MITFVVLLANLSCPKTIIENRSGLPWNADDQKTLEFNQDKCPTMYENSPCLIKFIKVRELGYMGICGAKRDVDNKTN